jgi:hypothetical protein
VLNPNSQPGKSLASKIHFDKTINMPSRSLVWFSCVYRKLGGIKVKPRYSILGISGYSLRNKIPIVGNNGEGEVGSMEG